MFLSRQQPSTPSTFASQPLSSSQAPRTISNTRSNIRFMTNTSRLFINSLEPFSIKIPNKIKISKKVLNQIILDIGSNNFNFNRTNIYFDNNSIIKKSNIISNALTRTLCFVFNNENEENKTKILKNLLDLCIIYESIYNVNKNNLVSYSQGNNWIYLIILFLNQEQLIDTSNLNNSFSLKLIIIYQLVFNDSIKTILNKNLDTIKIQEILNKYLPSPQQNTITSINNNIYTMITSQIYSLFQGRQYFFRNEQTFIDNLDFYKNLFMNICKIYECSFDNTVLEYNNLPPLLNNYSVYKQQKIKSNNNINLMTFEYIFVWLLNIIKKIKFRNPTDPYNYPEIVALPDFSIQDNFNLYFELKAFKASLN